MALSNEKIQGYIKRLLLSRMRILCNHGFFGLLLMHMVYSIDEEVETACTDGVRITFGVDFLDQLSDTELDFVMMHEIMHVVLQHCLRGDDKDAENFNVACDIVVNSNILLENNMNASSITLSNYGESMHTAPDGKEGYEYTAEQVYAMLPQNTNKQPKSVSDGGSALGRAKKAPPPDWLPICAGREEAAQSSGRPPRILYPKKHMTYYRDLGEGGRRIPLAAAADQGVERLHWFAGSTYLGSSAPDEPFLWEPDHSRTVDIVVVDDKGRSSQVRCRIMLAP